MPHEVIDMIDKKRLIEILEEWADNALPIESDIVTDVIDVVEEQPKASEWIPCSERLPETSGYYLITEIEDDIHFVTTRYFYNKNEYSIKNSKWADGFYNNEVIAWQPLPEPWGGERENERNNI